MIIPYKNQFELNGKFDIILEAIGNTVCWKDLLWLKSKNLSLISRDILFLPGSHKANFRIPEVHRQTDSPLFETYSCPPGSVIIFTENLCHSGVAWTNPDRPRIAVFNSYNFVGCQFHRPSVPLDVIEGLPPEKQAYFRDVWVWHQDGPDNGKNLRYKG